MSELTERIAANVTEVRGRIADAAARSGRSGDRIDLVAITKYVGETEVRALVEAGCDRLGESRPQELWQKAEACRDLGVCWHLVGHLQRNKVRRTLPLVDMVQSVDSPRLATAVDRIAGELSCQVRILLEINVSGDVAKHGLEPDAVEPLLDELAGARHLEVCGLMCMASFFGGPDAARRDFAALRSLRDRLRESCPDGVRLDELSMGMSGDYEAAVAEGATIVRIGSALFEGVL
ncbi:MAG: YggS family pyridoxal phosphate-dependent enzyme [Planctomycetota bacterium]|jgi:pyridoxal phosphate enzyme (YggS family)